MPARASPAGLWIGMMSGTSIDAVDGALVTFRQGRGGLHTELLEFASEPIDGALRDELLALQAPGPDELERAARAANALTLVYASVAGRLLRAAGDAAAVRAIGAHGQTVRHCPDAGFTIQLINGALLAARCGRPVVVDFRSADVAAGGQGAPLAPAFHRAAFGHRSRSRVVVNIGGIANVSLITPGVEPVVGFDTGPGNVLLDAWCQRHLGQRFDRDGAWAASGRVDRELLARMLAEPYFGRMPPKSTGRDLFNLDWLLRHDVAQRAAADVQATLLELTAATIAAGCSDFGAAAGRDQSRARHGSAGSRGGRVRMAGARAMREPRRQRAGGHRRSVRARARRRVCSGMTCGSSRPAPIRRRTTSRSRRCWWRSDS